VDVDHGVDFSEDAHLARAVHTSIWLRSDVGMCFAFCSYLTPLLLRSDFSFLGVAASDELIVHEASVFHARRRTDAVAPLLALVFSFLEVELWATEIAREYWRCWGGGEGGRHVQRWYVDCVGGLLKRDDGCDERVDVVKDRCIGWGWCWEPGPDTASWFKRILLCSISSNVPDVPRIF